MNTKFRKGDEVIVITGNDKGKVGKILFMKEERVVVGGVNIRKKHMKKTQENQKGQVISIERGIHISNIRHAVNEKPVKLKVRQGKEGKEFYYLDANKKAVSYRPLTKAKKS